MFSAFDSKTTFPNLQLNLATGREFLHFKGMRNIGEAAVLFEAVIPELFYDFSKYFCKYWRLYSGSYKGKGLNPQYLAFVHFKKKHDYFKKLDYFYLHYFL